MYVCEGSMRVCECKWDPYVPVCVSVWMKGGVCVFQVRYLCICVHGKVHGCGECPCHCVNLCQEARVFMKVWVRDVYLSVYECMH